MNKVHLAAMLAGVVMAGAAIAQTASPNIAVPYTPKVWVDCSAEDAVCKVATPGIVRYGAGTKFAYKLVSVSVPCTNAVFGDPIQGTLKRCFVGVEATPVTTPTPAPAPAPTPTPTSTPKPALKMTVGINVSPSVYYGSERTFANLAQGAGWKDPSAGWGMTAAAKLNAFGYPNVDGQSTALVAPRAVWNGKSATIKCTWDGAGTIRVDGMTRGSINTGGSFVVPAGFDVTKGSYPSILFYLSGLDATKPFSNLDCREPGLATVGQFDKELVDDLKPFKLLRFLDWSNTNGNPASVTVANRATPTRGGTDGFGIEAEVDLANAAGTDAWFTFAWNADETYVRAMTTIIRDRLAPGHKAYIELSNEVWNFSFPVATQALNEGLAQVPPLSTDKYSNNPLRYGQKALWFHKITTDVFKADPSRLVRVVASQSDNSWSARTILSFPGLVDYIDALAIAPYFGHSFFNAPNDKPSIDTMPAQFERLEAMRANAMVKVRENKAAADKYGKRLIAYEGGQHIIAPGNATAEATAMNAAMQRSPLMYQLYLRYLADWKAINPDLFTVYSATGGISQYGSWGIREYAGQPIEQTPKRKAVLEVIAQP